MKLMYVTPVFQHPQVRGSARCYYFARELAKRHDVTMLGIQRSEHPSNAVEEVQSFLRLFLFGACPEPAARGIIRKIQIALRERKAVHGMANKCEQLLRAEHFDAVLFHGKSVFPVINSLQNVPLVIDFCDATSMRMRDRIRIEPPVMRAVLNIRLQKLEEIEQKMIRRTPHLAFISSRDRDAVTRQKAGIRIVPNGVDLKYWQRRKKTPQRNTIVFTGVMDYRPNNDAGHFIIEQLLPLLLGRIDDLKVLIVGRNPSFALRKKAKKYTEVTVTGFVEDVRDYLEKAALFIAPIRYASGVQNKVLEAFAMEVPVICSTAVAKGLEFEDGEKPPVHVADSPEDFASNVVRLLNDDKERAHLSTAGRDFVERRFVWENNVRIFETMLEAARVEAG